MKRRPWVADVLAFVAAALMVGSFGYAVADHFTEPQRTVYEDGSWVDTDGNSGCLKGAVCND